MAKQAVTVSIPDVKIEHHKIWLIGTSPLIVHAFPAKNRTAMLEKQMKIAKGGRDARDPLQEVEDARYRLPDGRDGFPAVGFKACAVTACTSIADITKVAARQAFQVEGLIMNAPGQLEGSFVRTALVPIIAHEPMIREDVVRLSGPSRAAEMRYRPEYWPWGVELQVRINPQVISVGQLGSMFQAAGHGVGVGDYRPERNGDCGMFELATQKEFEEFKKENKL